MTWSLSAGGSLRQMLTGRGARHAKVLACYEEFSVGPLMPLTDLETLARARVGFWQPALPQGSVTG